MSNQKFLKKCQKAFKDNDLRLYIGLYPFNPITNKKRLKNNTNFITIHQKTVCDLILETGLPFIVEHKTIAKEFNHFYTDILVKTKYHLLSFEIDGKPHYTQKAPRKRDLKKAKYILKYHNIYTFRIRNACVDDYINGDKDRLNQILKFLHRNLFENKSEHIVKSERIGEINKRIGLAKKGIFDITQKNYV